MKILSGILAVILALAPVVSGADLILSGAWTERLTALRLAPVAGSKLQGHIESFSGATVLSISNAPGHWTLRAHLSGAESQNGVAIYIKRTSNGGGSGAISGGESYVQLTTAETELFRGEGSRRNISLQFKLAGFSAHVLPATYLSSITYTVQ